MQVDLIEAVELGYYEIVFYSRFANQYGRIRFLKTEDKESIEESQLYTVPELNEILSAWKREELMGSFGIGYKITGNTSFQLIQE